MNANYEEKMELKTYRLEEMLDAMKNSLENARKVKGEEIDLVAVVEEHAGEKFADFIKEQKASIEKLSMQIDTLEHRATLLETIVAKCKDDTSFAEGITMLLNALGVFND